MEKYRYIVELVVAGNGLQLELSQRIVDFHKARDIEPRHGRTKISRKGKAFYRWWFSDLKTAHAFVDSFGGTLREPETRYSHDQDKRIKEPIDHSVERPKGHGRKRALLYRMQIFHAVLFEIARLRAEGSADPQGEAMRKIAQVQNIEVETVERYCRVGRKFMKSSRAANFRPNEDIRAYVDDVGRLLSQE